MIRIEDEINKKLLNESASKQHHLFKDEKTTFRQLKQTLDDVLRSKVVAISKKVPTIELYLTRKDGDWLVSKYERPLKKVIVGKSIPLNEVESEDKDIVKCTIDDIVKACESLDDVFLNKCFANGRNCAHICLVSPSSCCDDNDKRCFLAFKGIDCFDDKGKCIGSDDDLGVKLLYKLNSSDCLQQELMQVPIEKLGCLKKCKDESKILADITSKLSKLIDGLGWGCSLKYYIEDKYSRYIINKALEHGIDLSKNGQLANELVSRLSGASMRPTKSDLVTFAKREGIDFKSDAYKQFLEDIENTASQMSSDIISPIEKIICYAIACVANNVIAMMSLDSRPQAQKLLKQVATQLFDAKESIDACEFDINDLQDLKKSLAKLCMYQDIAPEEIRIMYNGKPYSISCDCKRLQKLCDLI